MGKRHQKIDGRIVIGLSEHIDIIAKGQPVLSAAKVDTGATRCSIDQELAKRLDLGPVIKRRMVKSAQGNTMRPIIKVTFMLANKKITTEFTVADRSHLKFPVLIGKNALKKGFLIDPLL